MNVSTMALVVSLCLAGSAEAATNLVSSVLDGAGQRSTGGSLTLVSAVAQPGGVGVSEGGGYVHYAGWLNTFSLQPGLDTDGDGLADEVDQDNDGDSLGDTTELAGSAHNPNTVTDLNHPDTDGDGHTDGQEAGAGTNPDDANALLAFTRIERSSGNELDWEARGGRTYTLLSAEQAGDPVTNIVATGIPAVGGSAPWFETTASFTNTAGVPASRVYAVQPE